MFSSLPRTVTEVMHWDWSQFEPYYQELASRPLSSENVSGWLADWTRLIELGDEFYIRLFTTMTRNTEDREIEQRYNKFLEELYPRLEAANQEIKQKLLASGLEPAEFELPLRKIRTEAELFREANLPLLSEERKLGAQYNKIVGAQTVEWAGQELTLAQLKTILQSPNREQRERAWRLAATRWLADRQTLNTLWTKLITLRAQLAANTDLPNYHAYRWRQLYRFDYTPSDCLRFHEAIEEVAVPAATRIYEAIRQRLGVAQLRPWDLDQDLFPQSYSSPQPFKTGDELASTCATIFRRVHPDLGANFDAMRREDLLDLDNRKGKAPGGYCALFSAAKRPFIFMNAIGLDADVRTLLHEGGHAFHFFAVSQLPYQQQRKPTAEFSEVASIAMELLASPYLGASEGGFYSQQDAARVRAEHLERMILFWPYMAVVDAFQHWAYENQQVASDAAKCDAVWQELWERFIPGVAWSGLEEEMVTGWHRKLHIFRYPFYYVEYGLAQLGAMQVWRNALQDQAQALARYRQALSLGATVSIPQLYEAAGASFAFDAETLRAAIELAEKTVTKLRDSEKAVSERQSG